MSIEEPERMEGLRHCFRDARLRWKLLIVTSCMLIAVIIAVLIGMGVISLKSDKQQKPAPAAVPVAAVEAKRMDFNIYING